MTSQKPKPRDHAATKAELREMLAEAVRNTQHQPETKSNDTAPPKGSQKSQLQHQNQQARAGGHEIAKLCAMSMSIGLCAKLVATMLIKPALLSYR
jgi:hypothetical protein